MSILRDNHLKSIKKYKKVLKITYNVNIKRQPLKQFVHTHIQGLTHISFPSIEILLLYMKMQLLTWRFSLEVVPLIFFLYYMWSGHSRQLFSCSLGIRWPTNACFTYTLHTGLTFLCTYPSTSCGIVLHTGASWCLFLQKRW